MDTACNAYRRIAERRLYSSAFLRRLGFDVDAAPPQPFDLRSCALEFTMLFIEMQNAGGRGIIKDVCVASQVLELLAAVRRQRKSGLCISETPAWQTFKQEA